MLIRHMLRAIRSAAFLCRIRLQRQHQYPDAVLIIYNQHNLLYWLASDPGLKDRIVYRELVEQGYKVNVLVNPTKTEIEIQARRSPALAWLNPHHFLFSRKRRPQDYRRSLHELVLFLEQNFDRCIPSHADIQYWENKGYMHTQMERLGIVHPKTKIVANAEIHNWQAENYPLILKSEDGYSSNGLWLCHEVGDVPIELKQRAAPVIIQEFLNISFDIRVICVRGMVVSFYWRMNSPSPEWRPTATQNGATVKFIELPASVTALAKSIYDRTSCLTYGADICFRNDNLDSEPYVLEFSPIYQPNPIPPEGLVTQNYSSFKKGSLFKYDKAFAALIQHITYMIVVNDRMALSRASLGNP